MATIRDLHQLLHDAVEGNPKAWEWEVGIHFEGHTFDLADNPVRIIGSGDDRVLMLMAWETE